MRTHFGVVGRIAGVVLAAVVATSPAVLARDRDALSRAAESLSARPSEGKPSYQETVEWLSSHVKAHGSFVAKMSTVEAVVTYEIQIPPFPCILVVLRSMRAITTRRTSDVGFLFALHEINRATIAVTSHASMACVETKGGPHLTVEMVDDGSGDDPDDLKAGESRPALSLCFDTAESAQRAAKALRHAAELCGAADEKEPF